MSFDRDLEQMLIIHEDLKLKPYRCPAGKLTIGVGRNLDDVGISEQEAMVAAQRHHHCHGDLHQTLSTGFTTLSDRRRMALIDMAFNLGETRFRKFAHMLAAIAAGDFARAADETKNSRWYTQVGQRARTLETMMREG